MPTTYYPYDNGTVGPTGPAGPQGPPGPAGKDGVIQSVNGKSAASVTLTASDVNALPSAGDATLNGQYLRLNSAAGTLRAFGYKTDGVDRWLMQVDDAAEAGSAAGSNFRLDARKDDGSFNKTVVYARRDNGQIALGTTALHGSATVTSAGPVGLRDVATDPETASGGVYLYSKGGVPFFKNADGTSFQVQPATYPVTSVNGRTGAVTLGPLDVDALPQSSRGASYGVAPLDAARRVPAANLPSFAKPSDFDPTDLGLKAWSSDPAMCSVQVVYPTSGAGRVTAVKVNESMSVSRIVWYFKGYAGGLLAGSWAGIYDSSGALMGATGDLSMSAYEPQEQHAAGGGTSWSALTSAVTLAPGLYYVVWRMVYTESPVDGPAILAYDNSSACPSKIYNTWRWASLATDATSAPSTISVSSFTGDPKRFWVALA